MATVSYGRYWAKMGCRKTIAWHRKESVSTVSYGSHRSLRWLSRAPRKTKCGLSRPARDQKAGNFFF
ncbi:hypothetical protein HanIR_Chr02g0087031 [Helianthus annuus]|nr:hypothetical protein HanIR_Chr02g0087031 [Helianthus annuus]